MKSTDTSNKAAGLPCYTTPCAVGRERERAAPQYSQIQKQQTQFKGKICLKQEPTDLNGYGKKSTINKETNVFLKNEQKTISILEEQDEHIEDLPDKE